MITALNIYADQPTQRNVKIRFAIEAYDPSLSNSSYSLFTVGIYCSKPSLNLDRLFFLTHM